jgi:hypothetical protein
MRTCAGCCGDVEERFRFCPWCGAPQRLKIVDFFRPHAEIEGDRDKALRVSRYLGGSGELRHVRFSVWHEGRRTVRAEAAISLDEAEAERLAQFLADRPGVREGTTAPLR